MNLTDEPISDQNFARLTAHQQEEVIGKYCASIEERIQAAGSMERARQIAEETCGLFVNECPSSILRRALIKRVREMVEEYWSD